jgi:hypothetical protein
MSLEPVGKTYCHHSYYNQNQSWDEEIKAFADSVLNNKTMKGGTSEDVLRSMQLVIKIYYADTDWRKLYDITSLGNYK